MPYKNPEDKNKRSRERYQEIKEFELRRQNDYRKKYKKIVNDLKDNPCMDCGNSYPHYVMDFDHVRGIKCFNIGATPNLNPSLERLMAEIAKCDLVCSNCHRIRTWTRQKEVDNSLKVV